MKDLIEALQIFLKYVKGTSAEKWPTHCEHDELTVDVNPELVSKKDTKRLAELGFEAYEDSDHFTSFRFGSC